MEKIKALKSIGKHKIITRQNFFSRGGDFMLSQKLGNAASAMLDIGQEITTNMPKIILIGDKEVFCEGYNMLNEYTKENIKLTACGKIISIGGEELVIKSMANEEITISGQIKLIEYF